MRISTKGRHAVMAMVDLAANGLKGPVALAEIARRQDISLSYLEQLISRLKREGLVSSTRGPGGGYRLAHPPEHITAFQIVKAVDEQPSRVQTDEVTAKGGSRILTELLWQAINDEVDGYLKTISLGDVVMSSFSSSSVATGVQEGAEPGKSPIIHLPDLSGETQVHAA